MIALYRGTGLIGSAIRWQTRGDYSHAAWICEDGSCIEAWHRGGVRHVASPFAAHRDALIDVFVVSNLAPWQQRLIDSFLRAQVGAGYDWLGVARFLSGINRNNYGRWFCSELVAEACEEAGRKLLHAPAWKLAPSHLPWSTEVTLLHSQMGAEEWRKRRTSNAERPTPNIEVDERDRGHGWEVPFAGGPVS